MRNNRDNKKDKEQTRNTRFPSKKKKKILFEKKKISNSDEYYHFLTFTGFEDSI